MATVKDLKAKLDAAGVDYPTKARKPELEALAADLPEEPETVAPAEDGTPGLDPRLAAARDETRKVEERTRVGRIRHQPAGVDPVLVERAAEQRKADEERARQTVRQPLER